MENTEIYKTVCFGIASVWQSVLRCHAHHNFCSAHITPFCCSITDIVIVATGNCN